MSAHDTTCLVCERPFVSFDAGDPAASLFCSIGCRDGYFDDTVHAATTRARAARTARRRAQQHEQRPLVDLIVAFECGEIDRDSLVELFERLTVDGALYAMQGTYQRTARRLVDAGVLVERACVSCDATWAGRLACPKCGEPGEPLDD